MLEVTLTAHQDTIDLDTTEQPVTDALVFSYDLIRGTASNGQRSASSTYPAPSLHVNPGETLIVHMANEMNRLTIRDFYDPSFTPKGQEVPLYPEPLTAAPFNLHTHGLHVSPSGNSDNVLLDIPAGYTNTYTYRVPDDMPQGLYWYHGHRHTLTAQQTYLGLAGLLEIGDPSGGIPLVEEHDLPVRTMALQYNYVFDRAGGSEKLNDANWPQYMSTLKEPGPSELADGSYEPRLTPVNFDETDKGTRFLTNWYAGKLSVNNDRGRFQFIPSELFSFTPTPGNPDDVGAPAEPISADLSLPDDQRDVHFTVNGIFQPEITAAPGQTEIWVLANTSDFAYMNVALTETATGEHLPFAIVGQDGNPYPAVHSPPQPDRLLIPPASRYAIAVTMPEQGELILEMPPLDGNTGASGPGVLYTNDGTEHPPATLGTIDISPAHISYEDGFFLFPTQELVRMVPSDGDGTTVAFEDGQDLGAYTSFFDTEGVKPDVRRSLVISGGFDDAYASKEDPEAFVYQFDGNIFPFVPLLQPRLGSTEEWTFINRNNDQHPIHIHVNDFQVTTSYDPTTEQMIRFQPWGQDNANTPAPRFSPNGQKVLAAGVLTVRTRFDRYTGTYVMHCHRLNHEDNGLMALVNVIPARSTWAVALGGVDGADATVLLRDEAAVIARVHPFRGTADPPSVTMGDVDGDGVLDLVAGSPSSGEVVAYSGAGSQPFSRELARFEAFQDAPGGVNVAAADIQGTALGDNIIAAPGPGAASEVRVFSSALASDGSAPDVFTTWKPFENDLHGTEIAAGLVTLTGRPSIIAAPGPGTEAIIRTATFDLFTENGEPTDPGPGTLITSEPFTPFPGYKGGVSLSTGWVAGELGGTERIVIGQAAAPGGVKIYSSGSALQGHPTMYLDSPDAHTMTSFTQMASFHPRGPASASGVSVATTATTTGATLLVASEADEDHPGQIVRYVRFRPSGAMHMEPAAPEVLRVGSGGAIALGGD